MHRTFASLLALVCALAAPFAFANPDGDETVIIGTINYRGATSFPKNAKVVLQLVDLSRPMTPASVISELTFLDPKPVAWPYQLQYPARRSTNRVCTGSSPRSSSGARSGSRRCRRRR